MAKISNTTVYPTVTPADDDLLILTDANDSNRTKTVKLSGLKSYMDVYTYTVSVNVSSSLIQNSFAQPLVLIDGVAGYHIQPISILVKSTYLTAAYSFSSDISIKLGTDSTTYTNLYTVNNFNLIQGYSLVTIPIPATSVNASKYSSYTGGDNLLAQALVANPTLGDGTLTFDIMYRLVKA